MHEFLADACRIGKVLDCHWKFSDILTYLQLVLIIPFITWPIPYSIKDTTKASICKVFDIFKVLMWYPFNIEPWIHILRSPDKFINRPISRKLPIGSCPLEKSPIAIVTRFVCFATLLTTPIGEIGRNGLVGGQTAGL